MVSDGVLVGEVGGQDTTVANSASGVDIHDAGAVGGLLYRFAAGVGAALDSYASPTATTSPLAALSRNRCLPALSW
jgi:hypothetical protein